jgi:YD repeat-containing protein
MNGQFGRFHVKHSSSKGTKSSDMPLASKMCQSSPRFVGDPIDVVTGANTDDPADLIQRGPILFQWVRYYSSARSTTHCSLGWGQSHDFDRVLHRDLDGLRYEDPFGAAVGFPDLAIGASAAAAGMLLTRSGNHAFVISQTGQPSQEFEFVRGSDSARLARLRRDDNTIELRYADSGLHEIIDSRGRLIRVTSDPAARILQLVLADPKSDAPGRTLLQYDYDRAGNLVRATDLYGTTLSFAYDAANRMTRRTDRRGYSFHFEYDAQGRCVHSRGDDGLFEVFLDYQPDSKMTFVRRGDGGQWMYFYDDNGTVTKITDPYGNATNYTLDDLGRPVEEIDPNGNVTKLHYDWLGQHDYRMDPNGYILPSRAANPQPADPLAYELPATPLEWEFGRLVAPAAIKPPTANDPILLLFPAAVANTVLGKTTTYDASAGADLEGPPQSTILDDLGRTLEEVRPRFMERWKYDVNGNLIEHHDRDGAVYRSTYQSWNALRQEVDPLQRVTSIEHTVQGLVAKVTDPGGTVTEYGHDLTDRLVEVRRHGRVRERYVLDKAGNIVGKSDGQGLKLVRWELGPGNLDKVRILASGERHVFAHDDRGRVTTAVTPAGTATFTYDELGHIVADHRDGKGVDHEFDLEQLVSTTCFDTFKIRYETADNGDLIVLDPTGAQHRFKVSETGLIAKVLATGVRELCQYDAQGRCRRKATVRSAQDPFRMRSYAYSAEGDLLMLSDTTEGVTRYRYDAAHWPSEERTPEGTHRPFRYDAGGNLLQQPGLTGVVMDSGNRLREANGDRFTYNDRDHLSAREGASGTIRYEYNDLDMLRHQRGTVDRQLRRLLPARPEDVAWEDDDLLLGRFPAGRRGAA